MSIVSLLIALIVIALVWWAITAILAAFGLGDPLATLIKVVFVVLVVLWLLSAFGVLGGGPRFNLRASPVFLEFAHA